MSTLDERPHPLMRAKGSIVQHSARTVEWFTPPHVIELARRSMGGIDLDPATCPEANAIVEATRWYGRKDDGLAHPWHGRVFLNPPGAERGSKGHVPGHWWRHLVGEYMARRVTHATFVIFNLETLRHTGRELDVPHPVQFAMCWPFKRIAYVGAGGSPPHASAIVLLGAHDLAPWRELGRMTGPGA